jgi:hypothetical protein
MLIAELYLGTAFLPVKWQSVVNNELGRALGHSTGPPPTHPALDEEIGRVLDEHHLLRNLLYLVIGTLFILNGLLISKTWQYLRRRGPEQAEACLNKK